jgi:PadR family transcriptional regulator PadR
MEALNDDRNLGVAQVIRRLEADGDITWYWGDESQGGQRKCFRITEKGRAIYACNKSSWEYAKRVLDTLR